MDKRQPVVTGYITFKPNKLFYSQDFRMHRGVPAGVRFFATQAGRHWILQAPGYGEPGAYGNGRLRLCVDQSIFDRQRDGD